MFRRLENTTALLGNLPLERLIAETVSPRHTTGRFRNQPEEALTIVYINYQTRAAPSLSVTLNKKISHETRNDTHYSDEIGPLRRV